jgi:hypothetical protein
MPPGGLRHPQSEEVTAMKTLIVTAGLGQLTLVLASLAIPHLLHWREELQPVRSLTRRLFWVYAGYIWTTSLCFGLLSTFAPASLLDRSALATAVTAFMALYWGARSVIQFAAFDRAAVPKGLHFRVAETALVGLFFFLTCVYCAAAWSNVGGDAS